MYILKTFVVLGGYKREEFKSEASALDFADWLIGDQGLEGIEVIESYVECPMIAGVVYVPASIHP